MLFSLRFRWQCPHYRSLFSHMFCGNPQCKYNASNLIQLFSDAREYFHNHFDVIQECRCSLLFSIYSLFYYRVCLPLIFSVRKKAHMPMPLAKSLKFCHSNARITFRFPKSRVARPNVTIETASNSNDPRSWWNVKHPFPSADVQMCACLCSNEWQIYIKSWDINLESNTFISYSSLIVHNNFLSTMQKYVWIVRQTK